MPNWCNNHLTLTHEDPAMIQRAYDALERGEFLQEFIPVPKDLSETISGSVGDPDEQAKMIAKTKDNVEKYGYGNWYDYCVSEWGTKWDTGESGNNDIHPEGKMLTAGFDTAWSPPIAAYEKLFYMGFKVSAMYYEPGMEFAGIYEDGQDEYYEYGGKSSDEIAEELPSQLDEMFNISQAQAEHEEENPEEDLTEWIKDGVEKKALIAL